jgi:hypothetical protein
MIRNRSWCLAAIIVAGGLLAFMLAAGFYYYYRYTTPRMLDEKRLQVGPPSILVHSPQAGDTVPAGSAMSAEAMVTAIRPIARVEIWMDGQLAGTQSPDTRDQTRFPAFLELQISEGTHLVFWRAVDSEGLVGQSDLIPIAGEAVVAAEVDESAGADVPASPGGADGQQPPPGNVPSPPVPPASPGGAGGQQPPPGNAPSPPLPEPGPGAYTVARAAVPIIDFGRLIPVLLSSLPAAPSNLTAGFEPCTIGLAWNDNATNEDGFEVWMQAVGGPPLKIYTTGPNPGIGETFFEFDSPGFGIYGFWVVAFNSLGSQPSPIEGIFVNTDCPDSVASQLEIEVLGMRVTGGNWNQVYCFLSVENIPEKRVPEDDSQFLQVDVSGGADIYKWLGGENRILLKIPADEEVTLAGDCWAWLGDTAISMGPEPFSVSNGRDEWDNRTLQIRTPNYTIDYRIRIYGSTTAEGAFTYLDYDIPRPEIVAVEAQHSDDPLRNADLARTPTVRWTWNGNAADIRGFLIHVDGARASWVPGPSARQAMLVLPSTCGGTYEIQVAAHGYAARSPFSESVYFTQSPCPLVAEVRFLTAWSEHTDDTSCAFPDMSSCFHYSACDGLGIWYRLWAVNTVRIEIRGGTENRPLHYRCKVEYVFTNQLEAETDTIIIPIDPAYPELRIGSEFWEADLGPTDHFGVTFRKFPYTYDQWAHVDEDVKLTAPFMDGTADIVIMAHVRGYPYQGP